MGSAAVNTKEIDLSTRVPSFPGVYGGIVLQAKKGPIDAEVLCTNESQLLDNFTFNGRVEVGDDAAFFSAMAFLQKSNKLWVKRAVNGALFGGAAVKSFTSPTANFALSAGMADPTAYIFDSLPDTPAVAEITYFTFSQAGSFYDVSGAAKALQLFNSPNVGHFFYFVVSGGSNTQTNPVLTGTGHAVNILNGDTAAQVATAFFTAVAAVSAAFTATNPSPGVVHATNVTAGTATDATATGSAAAVVVNTQGAAAISAVDETLLLYQADPGAWSVDIGFKLTNYASDMIKVKEVGAFLIEIFKSSNTVVPVESFLCSRVPGTKDGFGNNIFVEDALLASAYLRAISNSAVASSVQPKDQLSYLALGGGDDGIAVTDGVMIAAAQDAYNNKDKHLLTILMDGGHATVAYQQALDTIARTTRKDCVAILSVPYSAQVAGTYLTDITDYKTDDLALDSSYSGLYVPHVKVYDKFNDRNIFVSPDGYAAAAISDSASNFEIWFPPAGFKRGSVTVLDLRRRFTKGEMDSLYDNGINPFRFVPGRGVFIWGQKTLSGRPSALDRMNVRLLLIVIEPAIGAALEDFLFDLNDAATRSIASALVSSYMENIKSRRGVTDFRVVCDDTNNTAEDIDAGRMNLWLFVKPTRSIEEIPFSVVITSTGISFDLAASLVA